VPVDLKTNEWSLLRDQFRALVHNEGGREDSLEQFVDDGIRRRFGEVISRACGGNGKQTFPLASRRTITLS
jgi:hypothetical protein